MVVGPERGKRITEYELCVGRTKRGDNKNTHQSRIQGAESRVITKYRKVKQCSGNGSGVKFQRVEREKLCLHKLKKKATNLNVKNNVKP